MLSDLLLAIREIDEVDKEIVVQGTLQVVGSTPCDRKRSGSVRLQCLKCLQASIRPCRTLLKAKKNRESRISNLE